MTAYPASLPPPQVSGYQVDVSFGVSAVTFEHGNARQRRSIGRPRHTFALVYVLGIDELGAWQTWANRYGYDWHYQNLASSYSGLTSNVLIPHYVRFTSDLSIALLDGEHVSVSVMAEMDAATLPSLVVEQSGDWILAGTPASPSSSDAILAGTPASPSSSNTFIAGSLGPPA